jgi:hypothetical protein
MNDPVPAKRNSNYPSIKLFEEVNRLRRRDSLAEFNVCEYGIALGRHFNTEEVPHIAEAVRNLQDQGVELRTPLRKRTGIFAFFSRLKPAPEPRIAEE